MKALLRNFVRLLSIGTFDNDERIEPMSGFKWNKLLTLAETCNVADYINCGIIKYEASVPGIIPQNIIEAASSGNKQPKATTPVAGRYNFTSGKRIKIFSNIYLNGKYNKIVFNEIHSIDTSIDSLVFMHKLIDNINTLLNKGLDLRTLADLGLYLRQNGDKIDFIKIEDWIRLLRARSITDIISTYLILLFHFDKSELPFFRGGNKQSEIKTEENLEKALRTVKVNISRKKPGFNQGLNPISKPNPHPLKYFKSYPLESSSRFLANTIKSLSNIDE